MASQVSITQVTSVGTMIYLNDPNSGTMSEEVTAGSTTTWRDYIKADGQIVAEHVNTAGTISVLYFNSDHLGSASVLTASNGTIQERDSYDAWGKRRNPNGTDNTTCSITSATTRGYTGQEMMDSVCEINLNARIYDPTIGRIMTADPTIPDPMRGQSYNRYSYVNNKPLSSTDPSGFEGTDSVNPDDVARDGVGDDSGSDGGGDGSDGGGDGDNGGDGSNGGGNGATQDNTCYGCTGSRLGPNQTDMLEFGTAWLGMDSGNGNPAINGGGTVGINGLGSAFRGYVSSDDYVWVDGGGNSCTAGSGSGCWGIPLFGMTSTSDGASPIETITNTQPSSLIIPGFTAGVNWSGTSLAFTRAGYFVTVQQLATYAFIAAIDRSSRVGATVEGLEKFSFGPIGNALVILDQAAQVGDALQSNVNPALAIEGGMVNAGIIINTTSLMSGLATVGVDALIGTEGGPVGTFVGAGVGVLSAAGVASVLPTPQQWGQGAVWGAFQDSINLDVPSTMNPDP